MIRVHLNPDDLAEIRFAFSPMWELGMSLMRAMRDPAKHALHMPWVQESRRAIEGHELGLLFALTSGDGYIPDFLTPPPTTPFPEFDEELERVIGTSTETVRSELRRLSDCIVGPLPKPAVRLAEDPPAWLPRLGEQIQEYWKLTIESHWPRIRALLEGDVMYRARQLALGGAQLLFADLHPAVSWRDGVLEIEKRWDAELTPAGEGVLLIPAVFDWPGVSVLYGERYQTTVSYAPRGIASLWASDQPNRSGALDELIGGTRADILRALEVPMTTSEIAHRLHLSPAAVSQQLGVLRRAGVVDAHRQGRGVYSRTTAHGRRLLELLS